VVASGPPPAGPRLALATAKAVRTTHGGSFRVRVRCLVAACSGRLSFNRSVKLRLAAGAARTVTFRLSHAVLERLERRRRLTVSLKWLQDGASKPVTLRVKVLAP
jgi:hypothetical protein